MAGAESENAAPALEKAPGASPGSPAARRVGGPSAAALALQASAGNAAVARLLQRAPDGDSSGGPAPANPVTTPGDQSSAGGPGKPGTPDYKKIIADKDTTGIHHINDFSGVEPGDRIKMIHILLEDTWWVGASDRESLRKLWEAWGTKGILDAYSQNEALWDACIAKEVNLAGLDALKPYREKFESDVKAVASVYQEKNAAAVKAERARLNLGHVDDLLGVGGEAPVPGKEIAEVQQLAREIQRADDLIAAFREMPVGTVEVAAPVKNQDGTSGQASAAGGLPDPAAPGTPAGGDGSGGGVPVAGAPRPATVVVDAMFVPEHPPPNPPPKGREGQYRSYDDVMKQFQRVTAARAIIASSSPALFAASNASPGEAGRIANMSPREAQVKLGRALNDTEQAIEKAGPMIKAGTLDWRDFTPIHQQLWGGMPASSGLAWNSKLAKSVAKDVIGDHKSTEFWRTMGLASLAAAGFLFSEIATGGMATFLWAAAGTAAGGTQAAISIQSYQALATAAQTSTSKDTQLVSQEQVTEAQSAAVLDSAFAFLDVFMAAKGAIGGVKAAAAASRAAAREGLEGLAKLAPEKAAEAVRKALTDLGPQETIRRAGVSVDDLVKIVGGEATADGKALRLAGKDAAVANPLGKGIEGLPASVPTAAGRKLAGAAHSAVWERWAALGTPQNRLGAMLDILNGELEAIGAPRLRAIVGNNIVLDGEITSGQWGVTIRPALLSADAPTEQAFASLWGLVSHEVEHGKQWFQVAQIKAANSGKSASEIAAMIGIPDRVAEAAIEVQVGRRAGLKLVQGTPEFATASTFERSLLSSKSPRNEILAKLESTSAENKLAKAEFEKVKSLPESDASRQKALERWQNANEAYDAAEIVYVKLPEEVAAYKAGGSAGASMTERFQLVSEINAAKRLERNALDKLKSIDAEMGKLAEGGKEVPYKLKVDFYTEASKAAEATDALAEATENLARAERGLAP